MMSYIIKICLEFYDAYFSFNLTPMFKHLLKISDTEIKNLAMLNNTLCGEWIEKIQHLLTIAEENQELLKSHNPPKSLEDYETLLENLSEIVRISNLYPSGYFSVY